MESQIIKVAERICPKTGQKQYQCSACTNWEYDIADGLCQPCWIFEQ